MIVFAQNFLIWELFIVLLESYRICCWSGPGVLWIILLNERATKCGKLSRSTMNNSVECKATKCGKLSRCTIKNSVTSCGGHIPLQTYKQSLCCGHVVCIRYIKLSLEAPHSNVSQLASFKHYPITSCPAGLHTGSHVSHIWFTISTGNELSRTNHMHAHTGVEEACKEQWGGGRGAMCTATSGN